MMHLAFFDLKDLSYNDLLQILVIYIMTLHMRTGQCDPVYEFAGCHIEIRHIGLDP